MNTLDQKLISGVNLCLMHFVIMLSGQAIVLGQNLKLYHHSTGGVSPP